MISVIIPVYNTAPYLKACLDSCFSQTYSDVEVLAVNDGSTDGSGALLDDYAAHEPRLKVFHQPNAGVVVARNKGIEHAKSDYLMFVDSDDMITPDAIELLLEQMTGQVDIAVGHYQEYFAQIDYYRQYAFPYSGQMSSSEFVELILLKKIQWGLGAKLYRRTLFDGVRSTKFKLGEDACALVQAVFRAQRVAFVPRVVYNYLQRSDSAVHRPTNNTSDIYKFRIWVVDFLDENGYTNLAAFNFFVVDGYTEYLLHAQHHELSTETTRAQVALCAKNTAKPLGSWQHLLLAADRYRMGRPVAGCLRTIQQIKFRIRRMAKSRC